MMGGFIDFYQQCAWENRVETRPNLHRKINLLLNKLKFLSKVFMQ